MSKLKNTQFKIEATKNRNNTSLIDEKSNDRLLVVTITTNRKIKSIQLDEKIPKDKDQMEDYLILTLNEALTRARELYDHDVATVA